MGQYFTYRGQYPDKFLEWLVGKSADIGMSINNPADYYEEWKESTEDKDDGGISSWLQWYKDNGFSKKEIEAVVKKEYGSVITPAKEWINNNF